MSATNWGAPADRPPSPRRADDGARMYEKLSDKLDRVVQRANEIAREYGHDYVGTEHLLLGIFRDGTGGAVPLMTSRGADEPRVRAAVDRLIANRPRDAVVVGRLPGTPHFQHAM